MKYNNLLFIAMIFLVSLLCVSAVSAADDAANDIIADTDTNDVAVLEESIDDASLVDSQNEENILKESDDEEKQLGDTEEPTLFYYLNQDVNNGNAVVDLTRDYRWFDGEVDYPYQHGVSINHNVTINGNGHTIDGNNPVIT